jgi:PAS domain S-box-containing protein
MDRYAGCAAEPPYDDPAWLRAALDALPSFVGYVDREHRNRFANAASEHWLGDRPQRIVGRHLRDILGPVRYDELEPYMDRAFAGEPQTFDRLFPLPDGRTVRARTHHLPHRVDGEVDGVQVYIVNISGHDPPIATAGGHHDYDEIIQRLFAAGMTIQGRLADESSNELRAAVDAIQLSISHLRDQIRLMRGQHRPAPDPEQ